MSVEIVEIEKGSAYSVNGKNVYLDADNKWIAQQELTTGEMGAFSLHRAAAITEKQNLKN